MSDLLARGVAWLNAKRHTHATRIVTYSRGEHTVDVQATPGQNLMIVDGEEVKTNAEERDWMMRPADLVLDAQTVKPERGDVIAVVEDGEERRFQVCGTAGEPAWRYADQYAQWIRVHTKYIGPEGT